MNAPAVTSWILISGEYPPALGGVADYTQLVARALAAAGDRVDVWTPRSNDSEFPADAGVEVHALPDRLGPRSLRVLSRELSRRPGARVLLQYAPHSFGMRGMNVPFCAWFAARRETRWVFFHEVAFPFERGRPWKHHVLAATQRAMASIVSRGADRVLVASPLWSAILRQTLGRGGEWLPVVSNVATHVPDEAKKRTRRALGLGADGFVVGHFGSYGEQIGQHFTPALRALLLADRRRTALLIGRNSQEYAARELADLGPQVIATGPLDGRAVAEHLAVSDVALQPYPEGVSSRRGTVMAAIALGMPVITNAGIITEPCWHDGAVALAPNPSTGALLDVARPLLGDPTARAALGRRARALYESNFTLDQLVEKLRGLPSPAHVEAPNPAA